MRTRIHRGLTLAELLAALASLSLLIVAIVSWVSTVASSSRTITDRARFESAALHALQRIVEDVTCGDFDPDLEVSERVRVESHRLIVTSRSRNPHNPGRIVERTYRRDGRSVIVEEHSEGAASELSHLIGDVDSVSFELSGPRNESTSQGCALNITIRSVNGREVMRSVMLP